MFVMPGRVPGIHAFAKPPRERRGWPGRRPAMTVGSIPLAFAFGCDLFQTESEIAKTNW
jgi:hypothetical protein